MAKVVFFHHVELLPAQVSRMAPGAALALPSSFMVNGLEATPKPARGFYWHLPTPSNSPQVTPPMARAQLQGSMGSCLAWTPRAGKGKGVYTRFLMLGTISVPG